MKKRLLSRSLFWASITGFAVAGMLALSACEKDDDDDDDDMHNKVYSLSGNASGAEEVPPVTTAGTGTLSGSYDSKSKSLIYSISWTGLTGEATVAHFHGPAAVGASATPLQDITITTNGTSGTAADTITASDALHTALLAGNVYYNIHTAEYPNGEIRAQVILTQ